MTAAARGDAAVLHASHRAALALAAEMMLGVHVSGGALANAWPYSKFAHSKSAHLGPPLVALLLLWFNRMAFTCSCMLHVLAPRKAGNQ